MTQLNLCRTSFICSLETAFQKMKYEELRLEDKLKLLTEHHINYDVTLWILANLVKPAVNSTKWVMQQVGLMLTSSFMRGKIFLYFPEWNTL